MTTIDWIIVVVLLGSFAVACLHGLVREVIALIGWIAAFVLAMVLGASAATLFPADWNQAARLAVGHLAVFLSVLIVANMASWLAGRFVQAVGLGLVDRILGGLFGLARGVLIVFALVMVANLTVLSREPSWKQSLLLPYVFQAMQVAQGWLPDRHTRHA